MKQLARTVLGPWLPAARRVAARHRARIFAGRLAVSPGLWLTPLLVRRRFHAYGLGLPKTGTHSVSGLFARHYRSMHEADAEAMVDMIIATSNGAISAQERTRRILRRDRYHQLELDSSLYNFFVLEVLLREFPQARFLLTVRHPASWVNSLFDQTLVRGQEPYEARFTAWMNQPGRFTFSRHERVLEEHGLHPLDVYLEFWTSHTRTVLSTVPPERLLTIRIEEIAHAIPRIAGFLNIPPETLDSAHSHLWSGPPKKLRLLSKLDPSFVSERLEAHCGDLIRALLPEASAAPENAPNRPTEGSSPSKT